MISFTPGRAASRDASTRPSLPTNPMAVRWAPRRAASPPASSVHSDGKPIAVVGGEHLAAEGARGDRGGIRALDRRIKVREYQAAGGGGAGQCPGLARG